MNRNAQYQVITNDKTVKSFEEKLRQIKRTRAAADGEVAGHAYAPMHGPRAARAGAASLACGRRARRRGYVGRCQQSVSVLV